MNAIMNACGLSSSPRWIELESLGRKRHRKMCSACGEIVNKIKLPEVCPNCGERMKKEW